MTIDQVIADNLSALMDKFPEFGSQKLLYKRSGVTTSTIGRIRRGEVSPTAQVIDSLAKAFDIPPGDLLDPSLAKRLKATTSKWELTEKTLGTLRSGDVDEPHLRAIEVILKL